MNADEALKEWATRRHYHTLIPRPIAAAFKDGYRRALLDAADTMEAYGDGADAVQDEVGIYWDAAETLREQAAAVGIGEPDEDRDR